MVDIKLEIDEEIKTFVVPIVKGIVLRDTLKIAKILKNSGNDFDENILDLLVDYIVGIFGNKFTRDQVYKGLDLPDLVPTAYDIIEKVQKLAMQKIKN